MDGNASPGDDLHEKLDLGMSVSICKMNAGLMPGEEYAHL